MSPLETTQIALQFAGPAAPGWLFLLIPAAAAIAWSLYRTQFRDVGRFSRTSLLIIRCLILAGILFLIFRPVIVSRKVLTYPGRILMVIDDSESMAAADNRLPSKDALYIARRLDPDKANIQAEYHQVGDLLRRTVHITRTFQSFSRRAERSADAFWLEAERIELELVEKYDAALGLLESAAGEPVAEADQQLVAALKDLRENAAALFAGERHPGMERFDAFYDKTADLRGLLLDRQKDIDDKGMAQPDTALSRYLAEQHAARRIELLQKALAANLSNTRSLIGNQFLQTVKLMTDEKTLLVNDAMPIELATVRGETNIVESVSKLVEEENSFPLTAVILFSDGRDVAKGDLARLKQELTRRRIPFYAAAVGDLNEPNDLAVVKVVAPPFAVEGENVAIKVHLKTVLPKPGTVVLNVLSDGQEVAASEVLLGEEKLHDIDLSFVPQQKGIARYTVAVETVSGEAFPRRNNRMDFAMDVRSEPVRVLLLDWKPRWETRFAGTVLRNLDYVELNSIILMAQPNLELERGVGRGYWPDSFDALDMYELLIIGDVPEGILTESEIEDIHRFVEEEGKAICFLSPELPVARQLMNDFIPTAPPASPDGQAALQVIATAAGQLHPTTFRFEPDSDVSAPFDTRTLLPDTQVLAIDKRTRQPHITARFVGEGRAMSVVSHQLWRANQKQYAAHREAYIQMMTWALHAGIASDGEKAGPALAVDGSVFNNRRGFQVWICNADGADATVRVYTGDDMLGEAEGGPHYEGAGISRAAFFSLQHEDSQEVPGDVRFALKEYPEVSTGRIVVIDDYRELDFLAQNQIFLQKLAEEAGGTYRSYVDFEDFFYQMEAKARTEKIESRWRIWNSTTVLAIVAALLTIQWIWRKIVGLV